MKLLRRGVKRPMALFYRVTSILPVIVGRERFPRLLGLLETLFSKFQCFNQLSPRRLVAARGSQSHT